MAFASIEGSVEVPVQDIVSFSFAQQGPVDNDTPILIDADDPSRFLTYSSCKNLVRKLIAGFRQYGLQRGESVMCHMANSVSILSIYQVLVLTLCISIFIQPCSML